MDILYRFYEQLLERLGISESIIIAFWFVLLFCLTLAALIIVVTLLYFLEQKIILPLISRRKGEKDVTVFSVKTVPMFCTNFFAESTNKRLFLSVCLLMIVPLVMGWLIVPYSNKYMPVASGVNLLLFLSIFILPIAGIILLGIASNNKFVLLKALRSSSQGISYEIPMMISVLGVVVLSSSLNINEIIHSQSVKYGILGWYFVPAFIGFLIFFVGMLAQINCFSFEFLLGKSEKSKEDTPNYTVKPAILVFCEYAAIYIMAMFFVCLFLGGYLPPFGFYLSEVYEFNYIFNTIAVYFEQIFWFAAKTFVVVFILMSVRASFPVFKNTKIIKFAWKWLVPLSLLNFIVICVECIVKGMQV